MSVLEKVTRRNAPFVVIAIGNFVVAAYLIGITVWLLGHASSGFTSVGVGLFAFFLLHTVGGAGFASIFGIVVLMACRSLPSLSRIHYAFRVVPVLILAAFFWWIVVMFSGELLVGQ